VFYLAVIISKKILVRKEQFKELISSAKNSWDKEKYGISLRKALDAYNILEKNKSLLGQSGNVAALRALLYNLSGASYVPNPHNPSHTPFDADYLDKFQCNQAKAAYEKIEISSSPPKKKGFSGLLKRLFGFFGLIGFVVGIFFLSPSLTGNSIGNLTQNSSNIFGAVLFILGLVGIFVGFNSKKKLKNIKIQPKKRKLNKK